MKGRALISLTLIAGACAGAPKPAQQRTSCQPVEMTRLPEMTGAEPSFRGRAGDYAFYDVTFCNREGAPRWFLFPEGEEKQGGLPGERGAIHVAEYAGDRGRGIVVYFERGRGIRGVFVPAGGVVRHRVFPIDLGAAHSDGRYELHVARSLGSHGGQALREAFPEPLPATPDADLTYVRDTQRLLEGAGGELAPIPGGRVDAEIERILRLELPKEPGERSRLVSERRVAFRPEGRVPFGDTCFGEGS